MLARFVGFSVALAMLVSSASEEVFAQKKKNAPKDVGNPAEPADYKTLGKEVTGHITSVNGGTISFRVETQFYEPNPNYKAPQPGKGVAGTNPNLQNDIMRRYQDLARQKDLAMRAKNPIEQQRAMQRYQQDMYRLQMDMQKMYAGTNPKTGAKVDPNNSPFRVATKSKDFELELQDKLVVRKMYLPLEYDDLGNIKTYNDKEKAELRGDDKTKPGYTSKIEDAYPGVEARLVLIAPKPAKKPAEKKPDDDNGLASIERPTVAMIILTKDAPTPGAIQGADKKKKAK